ncbi:outer membrane beta-barrel protein [Lysobacter xanthus]
MKKTLALALALAAAPFAASAANGVSHTYVEGGFTRLDANTSSVFGGDTNFDGGYVRGSYAFGGSYYVFGGLSRATNDDFGSDIDLDEQHVGIGWAMPVSDRAEFNAEIGYLRQSIEALGESDHGEGARASAGFRAAFNPSFEGWIKANYNDAGDFDGDWSGTLGAQVKINPTWGIVAELENGDGYNQYNVGVRASF